MGGKSSPEPPDYSPMAKASERAAELSYDLGQQQLDFAREQYNRVLPTYEKVSQSQIDAQRQSMDMAQELYNRKKDTYYPLEDQFIERAQEYNTDAYQEQLARGAAADSGKAFTAAQEANQRQMASMGVNPNSGKYRGLQDATTLQQSAQRANAMTSARERANQTGLSLLGDAASLGGNLTGLSQNAYQVANQSGSAGASSNAQPGQAYMSNMSQGIGTMQTGASQEMKGLSSILNAQSSVYNTDVRANAQEVAAIGQGIGMVGGGLAQSGNL